MRRVGEVVRVAQGLAVVRSPGEEFPGVGTSVVDESLTEVGRVVAVFGPVERPYLAVSPNDGNGGAEAGTTAARLVGQPVYARE